MTKLNALILIAILICPIQLHGTTCIVWITPHGIVVGTDSKMTTRAGDFSRTGEDRSTLKYSIVQDRIVVAAVGASDVRGGANHYNFLTWMKSLELKFPVNASVDDVANVIQNESSVVFATFTDAIKNGSVKREQPDEVCKVFIQYFIAGYQNGTPRLYEVQLYFDWNNLVLVGPQRILLEPQEHPSGNIHIHLFGVKEAIAQVSNTGSYAYRQAMARCPKAFGNLIGGKDTSLNDTVALVRVLIKLEEETNPGDVGGEIRVVRILPNGRAEDVIRKTPPKAATEKQKKTEN